MYTNINCRRRIKGTDKAPMRFDGGQSLSRKDFLKCDVRKWIMLIMKIKDKILQILTFNKELIENTFDIDDEGIDNIKKFVHNDYENFKEIVDKIFMNDMKNKEKMILFYLIGYANGRRVRKIDSH